MAEWIDRRSDAALLSSAGTDATAFAAFYRRYEHLVLGWALRKIGDPETAADLMAETFAAAWLSRGRYEARDTGAGPWLLGIAHNKLRSGARKQRIERAARDRLGVQQIVLTDDRLREIEDLFSNVDDCLAALPEDQRAAVRAHVVSDEAYADLAARLHVSEATVRKRVSRGLAGLRRVIGQEGEI